MIVLSTDTAPSIDIEVYDDSGIPVTGLVAATMPTVHYSVGGGTAKATIALSDLAAETTAWSAGGLKERGNGVYRLDLPTAAINVAGRRVRIFGYSTGKNVVAPVIDCGPVTANVTHVGGTAQTPKDLGASVTQTADFGRLIMQAGTCTAGSTTTATLQTAIGGDNYPNGAVFIPTAGTGANAGPRLIVGYVNSTRVATFDRAYPVALDATTQYIIVPLNATRYTTNTSLVAAADVRQALGNAVTTTNAGILDTYTASMATGVLSMVQFNVDGRLLLGPLNFISSATTSPATAGVWTTYVSYLNRPSFFNAAGSQRLWYDVPNDRWVISATTGSLGSAYWTTPSGAGPDGVYTPGGTATGVPDLVGFGTSVLSAYQPKMSGLKIPASIAAGDIATDAINGAALKADAITKIQNGLATSAAVAALPSAVAIRTEIDTNSTKLAAILTAVNNINNLSALANLSGSPLLEIPSSGSAVYPFVLTVRDVEGHLLDLDSLPTVTLINAAGTSRSSYLSSTVRDSLGVYKFTVTIASNAPSEALGLLAVGTAAGSSRRTDFGVSVVDYDAITTLSNIYAKVVNLPADPASESAATNNRNAIVASIPSAADNANAVWSLAESATNVVGSIGAWFHAVLNQIWSGVQTVQSTVDTIPVETVTSAELDEAKDEIIAAIGGESGSDVHVSGFSDAALAAMKATLSAVVIRVRGPVFVGDDGSIDVCLTVGDDYSDVDGRAIEFDFDGTALPDLTGAVASLVCVTDNPKKRTVVFTGTLTVATGNVRTVRFTPTSVETSKLIPSAEGEFWIAFRLVSGRRITPEGLRGVLSVVPSKVCEC